MYNFAAEQATGISSLGLNLKSFLFQLITFLIILWLLNKYAFSKLFAVMDERKRELEEGLKAAEDAKNALSATDQRIDGIVRDARKQSDDILAATNKEVADLIAEAEKKAARRAENIVAEAKRDMDNQVQSARSALKSETRKLVAEATEQIIGEKVDATKDASIVERAIKTAEGNL